jgi:hypothetical protein
MRNLCYVGCLGRFFYSLLFCALLSACGPEKIYSNTEIICPTKRLMVRYANAEQLHKAMEKALADKIKYRTSETYTVIRFSRERSFKIEGIAPEDIVKCDLREYPLSEKELKMIDYYFE